MSRDAKRKMVTMFQQQQKLIWLGLIHVKSGVMDF